MDNVLGSWDAVWGCPKVLFKGVEVSGECISSSILFGLNACFLTSSNFFSIIFFLMLDFILEDAFWSSDYSLKCLDGVVNILGTTGCVELRCSSLISLDNFFG